MFSDGLLKDATVLSFNYMETSWVENLGNGKFKLHALPIEAQYGPVYGILPKELNDDEFVDFLMVGNDFGMEVQQGMADALVGLTMLNEGNGKIKNVPLDTSHFFVPGDAKAIVSPKMASNDELVIASQNNDSLRVFEYQRKIPFSYEQFTFKEVKALVEYMNGSKRLVERYWGDSFQSQSGRNLQLTPNISKITFYDNLGRETRQLEP